MARTADEEARAATEAAARRSYGKLVAFLATRFRDVAAAEDALSEAFAAALADWPVNGVPDNPEGWLMAVARRKSLDALRRRATGAAAGDHLRLIADEIAATAGDTSAIPDERLRLMFACAHPALDPAVRAPLILQTVLGFDAATIASAFLVAPATMGQRLVRAKAKISHAGIPFRIPDADELDPRLDAVLEAIYATFTEGWAEPGGSDGRRRELAGEAVYLGRLVASLLPEKPEALGLLSLMLHSEARRGARRNAAGDYVPLGEQDTALWDAAMIEEAESVLRLASAHRAAGRYQIEAAIQSAHAARRRSGPTDWAAVVTLYEALAALTGSPVVAINRAIAIGELDGPAAGLAALEAVGDDSRLADYQPYWAARAALLQRAGAAGPAAEAYGRAIGLESDPAVRRFLAARRAELA
jgi:RNA polymerase sigma-70 factor (ECF subfamily)